MTDNIINLKLAQLTKFTKEIFNAPIGLATEDNIELIGKSLSDIMTHDTFQNAMLEALERAKCYDALDNLISEKLIKKGFNPYLCYNLVCACNENSICNIKDNCHSCLFHMPTEPPNPLDYTTNEIEAGVRYMPSHKEALQMLVDNDLLKDEVFENMIETKFYKYECKAKTPYDRDQVKIDSVTFGQLRGIIKHALNELYCDHTTIVGGFNFSPSCPDFDLSNEDDQEIFCKNLCITIEKIMGIYPNIRQL